MKSLLLPSFFVLAIVGAVVVYGSSISKKQVAQSPTYFDQNAKVMFFYSDLCSWCQKEKPVLKELAKEGFRVKPMNVDAQPGLWTQYKIEGTPIFIASDGQRLIGYQEKEKLREFLEKYK